MPLRRSGLEHSVWEERWRELSFFSLGRGSSWCLQLPDRRVQRKQIWTLFGHTQRKKQKKRENYRHTLQTGKLLLDARLSCVALVLATVEG